MAVRVLFPLFRGLGSAMMVQGFQSFGGFPELLGLERLKVRKDCIFRLEGSGLLRDGRIVRFGLPYTGTSLI